MLVPNWVEKNFALYVEGRIDGHASRKFAYRNRLFGDSSGSHGFINTGGTFTTLDVPGAGLTFAFGINDAGQVAGLFSDSSNVFHGFINTGGTFTTLDVPGASLTDAFGINNAGQVVGVFSDSSGTHGFVASPVPLPAAVWLLGTTLGGLGFVRRRLV